MPGLIVHVGASVLCTHAGQAQPTTPFPRVLVSGQPVVTIASPYVIAGCTFPAMSSGAPPCATGPWITGSTRVLAGGQPLVLNAGSSVCAPTGTPMIVAACQPRVTAM